MRQHYDVIVVGAGMVGGTLACALHQSGFKVALVEAAAQTVYVMKADYDLRVSALSLASKNIFEHIGVWQGIVHKRLSPYQQMHVWDAHGSGEIHFSCDELNYQQLGYIVENSVIQASLQERLREQAVDVFWQSKVLGLTYANQMSEFRLDNGEVLSADLVVGADGAQSKIRELAGISVIENSYYQKGVVAVVETTQPHQHTAWQRFLSSGPLAFLPLQNGCCSIVWSTSDADALRLCELGNEEFCAALAEAFEYKLGNVKAVGPRASFPLKYMHAQNYIKPGIALVGDAAHVVHPLAGQGVNLGLLDVAQLLDCVLRGKKNNRAIGSVNVLRRYERCRGSENQMMLFSMDMIKKLFSSSMPGLVSMRNLGLQCVDRLSPLKQLFMRQAMGISVDLPPLAQPINFVMAARQHENT